MSRRLVLRGAFAVWALLALLPVVVMLIRSLSPGDRFGFGAYAAVLGEARQWELLGGTLLLAGTTSLVAAVIGVPLSLLLVRSDLPMCGTWLALFTLPLLLPPTVLAYGWRTLLGRDGILGQAVGPGFGALLFSPVGCVLVMATTFLPIVLLLTASALRSANPSLEEAARLCAPPHRVLLGVTVPQVLPALSASLLLVFCLTLGEAGVPTFLRVNAFSVESLTHFAAFYDFAAATAAGVPLILATLVVFRGFRFVGTLRAAPWRLTNENSALHPFRLARARWGVAILVGLAWLVLIGLPLSALLVRSASVSAIMLAVTSAGGSLLRSLGYASAGASLILVFGFLAAYGRAAGELGKTSESLPLFMFALPGPVLGIGMISLWNRPGTSWLYGTPAILVLGLCLQYLVIGVWGAKTALGQLPKSLEEAAACMGVAWGRRLSRIILPLCWRGLAATWLLGFLFCLRDTGLAMVLYPPGQDPVTVRLFTLMANGRPSLIAAICALTVFSSIVGFAGAVMLESRRTR